MEKFTYEEIENYIIERELGFCNVNTEKEEIIKNNSEYTNLLNIHKMITECAKDNEFIFKNVFKSKEVVIEKNTMDFEFLASRMFFKIAGVAAILMILFLPLKLFLEKQINMMNQKEKVSINPKDFFDKTEFSTITLSEKSSESKKILFKEDEIMIASIDKIEDIVLTKEEKNYKDNKKIVAGIGIDKVYKKEVNSLKNISKPIEILPKEEKIMVTSVDKVDESKIIEQVEKSTESEKKLDKMDVIMVATADEVEKQLPEKDSKIDKVGTIVAATNLRGKKIADSSRTSLSAESITIPEKENKNSLKLKSKYLKVNGIENNKIYTKVKITFETMEGYNYKYYINNEEYKEGTEYRVIGTHKFLGEIYKANQLVDEIEIIFDVR